MNNFVSRDGIAPADFRREARAQIAKYPNLSFRDEQVAAVTGSRGDFRAGAVRARRLLLATGISTRSSPHDPNPDARIVAMLGARSDFARGNGVATEQHAVTGT